MWSMKISNGRVLIFLGVVHSLLGTSPYVFGKQFTGFAHKFYFRISEGLYELPILNSQMNYENFFAFWFCYFGLLLIPLGFLVEEIKQNSLT